MRPEKTILTCLGLKKHETILIVHDGPIKSIAESIFTEANLLSTAELIEIPKLYTNGEEPPEWCANKMLEHDVIVLVTSKSLSHTNARKNATDNGARLASMPGITDDILSRAIDVDYKEMHALTNKLADILDDGSSLRITTDAGTEMTMNIANRKAHGRSAGIYHKKGDWGNLPCGEAFISPVEGTANGTYVVDASQAGVGKLRKPITITVKDGFAIEITGGIQATEFQKQLEDIGDKNAFNVAELGIGTNPKAKVIGVVLEDEKVFGTAHVALGNNFGFGGTVEVPIHVDGVMREPTIFVDDKIIMEKGRLLV